MALPFRGQLLVGAALVASAPAVQGGSTEPGSPQGPPAIRDVIPAGRPGSAVPGAGSRAWVEREAYVMGTLLRLRIAAPDRGAALSGSEAALAAVEGMEARLSTWRSGTEMDRANRAPVGEPVPLSAELTSLLAEAFRWAEATGGAFDPAVGALVDAWDLRGAGRRPTPHRLERAMAASGAAGIRLDPGAGTLTRLDEAAWVDPGGFGKGAALRRARDALSERGLERGLLDFGGQVLALGSETGDGTGWEVEVAHPSARDRPVVSLRLSDASAATTGTSERFVEVDGERVGHLLDPRTGRPVAPWGSVTVVARDPLTADALSTALYVLGADGALEWGQECPDVGVLVLEDVGRGEIRARWSPGMERWLEGPGVSGARGTDRG